MIKAYAAGQPGGKLQPFTYDPGPLGETAVEVLVESCGVCHSDLSMLDNDWGMTSYPFVPGHEIIGRVAARGEKVAGLEIGQQVGIGWFVASCMHCEWCRRGDLNLCASSTGTIVSNYGGFADRVRCEAAWVVPLPENLDAASAGPLFCGGITVFNPIVQFGVRPTDRVGVIGIGGLGHLAIAFLHAWGCEVTAFSSSPEKRDEVRQMGADRFVDSRDREALKQQNGRFDYIISTVNVTLDWPLYLNALRPKGRLHFVGAVPEPLAIPAFSLIGGQKSVSGSPVGSPETVAQMLDFAARHDISPTVEYFPFARVNEALDHLRSGKARYRIVLQH